MNLTVTDLAKSFTRADERIELFRDFSLALNAGEAVTVKRGGFILESVGNIGKAEIGSTAYSISTNAWTVTKTSGTKTVGKIADVRDDGVVVVVGK